MTLRANKVFLAGSVVSTIIKPKVAAVVVEVPKQEGEANKDTGVVPMTQLRVFFRDDAMVELAKSMTTGDFVSMECEYYKQQMVVDGKDTPWGFVMLAAMPGHVIHIPKAGAATRMAGGGVNLAVFAGTVIRNDGLKTVGQNKTHMVRLSVACEPKYDKKMSMDEKKALTVYMDVTAWRGLAEKWLHKAQVKDSILVVGHVIQRVRDDIKVKGQAITMSEIDIKDVSLETPTGGGGGRASTSAAQADIDQDLPF